jgi:hypothetical protein
MMIRQRTGGKPNANSLANLRRGGGRPKGVPNKATLEAKQACAEIVDDPIYRAKLLARARAGKLAPAMETLLWYYAKGKPKETIEYRDERPDVSSMATADLKEDALKLLARPGFRFVEVKVTEE